MHDTPHSNCLLITQVIIKLIIKYIWMSTIEYSKDTFQQRNGNVM